MPHLVFVVNNADFLVSHRLVLVRGALEAGYRVSAIAPEGPAFELLRAQGCTPVAWKLRRTGQHPIEEALAVAQLTALYRSLAPDIVHHVTVKPMLYGSFAARAARVPAVVNAVSGLGYVFLSTGVRATLRREVLKRAYRMALTTPHSAVILQNDDDERALRQLGVLLSARVVKIRGSGVDLLRFAPSPEPQGALPVVVLPARLLVDKGVREFVGAARSLKGRGRFVLVGGEDEGNPAGISRAELDGWVAEGAVEWWGHRSDMPQVLREANVVCLPSYREGMPKALLEAAAIGRAIVTTDVPGCRDAVANGQVGVLVPARDSAALTSALGAMLGDAGARTRLAALSARYAQENFSETKVLRAHLELYRALGVG
jgi:glycosyltransferase involved in cell wall biosynthesis